jgi:hypothetical protein
MGTGTMLDSVEGFKGNSKESKELARKQTDSIVVCNLLG